MAKRDHMPEPPTRRALKRHGMVKWFAPTTLIRSGLEVLLSGLFARFADKRELQAGLPPPLFCFADTRAQAGLPQELEQVLERTIDEQEPFWIDFASDVGDGFDSTYTVAWLLAQERLRLELGQYEREEEAETSRGDLLVLGGDQVYPAAEWDRYQERFALPYTAALPFVGNEAEAPRMFAIPGNHDWYDGLTSFVRLLCQGDWIGGWHTRQRRSYFAIGLPRGWWLWGIDIQFDTYIDEPQLDFFEEVAHKHLRAGDRVILATSKPSWVHVREGVEPPQSWKTLAYFEERIVREHRGVVALTITGDIHHYCHYEGDPEAGPAHRITAGGGGAYMSATHPMPEELVLPGHREGRTDRYTRGETYPGIGRSRQLRKGILDLASPLHTPTLGVLLGVIYALFALLLAAGIKDQEPRVLDGVGEHDGLSLFGDALTAWWVLLALALGLGLAAWAKRQGLPGRGWWPKPILLGSSHVLLHLGPLAVVTLLALEGLESRDLEIWKLDFAEGFWPGFVAALEVFVFGFVWGPIVLALYLFVSHYRDQDQHSNDVFAAQAIEDYKCFVRMRIAPDGRLTVFPVGVPRAASGWTAKDRTERERHELRKPWLDPPHGEARAVLIERPFEIERPPRDGPPS